MYRNIHELRDLNRILNKWESYFQKVVLSSRPIFVQLPTGTKCNLKCSFCTDREGEANDSYKNLSFQEFLPLSGPLSLASLVQLYGWGEPFVNPDYEKVFDYVTGNYPGIQVYISTNGVLMKERWVKKLASYGNVIVNVSLNAATPETYSRVMRADRFQEVLENIRNLDQARKKSKFDLMLLLSFVALKQNIEELPMFVELASDLGAGVMVQDLNVLVDRHKDLSLTLYPEPGRVSEIFKLARLKAAERNVPISSFGADYVDNSALCGNFLIGSGEERVQENNPPSYMHPMAGLCYEPWQRMMIGIDGSVTPCCHSGMVMGNLYRQSWIDIWNGEMYRYLRGAVNSAYPPQDCLNCPARAGR